MRKRSSPAVRAAGRDVDGEEAVDIGIADEFPDVLLVRSLSAHGPRTPPTFRQPILRPLGLQTAPPTHRKPISAPWSGDPATLSSWRHGFESRWGRQLESLAKVHFNGHI
jgi:hypothetical protein